MLLSTHGAMYPGVPSKLTALARLRCGAGGVFSKTFDIPGACDFGSTGRSVANPQDLTKSRIALLRYNRCSVKARGSESGERYQNR